MKKLITLVTCFAALTAAAGTTMTVEQCIDQLLSQPANTRLQAGAGTASLDTLVGLIDEQLVSEDGTGAPARINATTGSVDDAVNQVVEGSKRLPVVNDRIEQQQQQ